ncbi:MAG: hypothetical protein K6F05_01475 [Succinivibrio sp.]|nr:hypothetical protein [Succinivibrio sp.]
MSIDSSALTSINNALSSIGATSSSKSSNYSSAVQTLTYAAASASTETRYKQAFEDKLKLANNSEDTVEISDEALEALRSYVTKENSSSESESTTYDYATLKKQREANYAALQAEVEAKYGHKSTSTTDTTQETEAEA